MRREDQKDLLSAECVDRSFMEFDHVWFWKTKLFSRRGQPCRVLARGAMNSILVEFKDGYRVITGRYAVRQTRNR